MAARSSLSPAALAAVRLTHAAHATAIDALERAFDADMALLAKDRRALEFDRAAFVRKTDEKLARDEEEQARTRASMPPPDELVKLNVGGARFETSRATLTKVEDSMLGRMFGRCDTMLQSDPEDGSIFIDREGERFGMLLDFLRGDPPDGPLIRRAIRALPKAAQEAMIQELDYFGLEAAVFGERAWTDATFRPGPETNSGRVDLAAVFASGPFLTATEVLHLSTLTLTPGPALRVARYYYTAVALDARRILVVGGNDGVSRLSSTESLDTMVFTPEPTWPLRAAHARPSRSTRTAPWWPVADQIQDL